MADASPKGSITRRSVERVGHWLGVSGEYNIVEQVLGGRAFQLDPGNILVDKVRRILFGKGVSVASIIHARLALDEAGFKDAQIVGSSGFDPQKCQVMGAARAPLDMVGTGSFLPATSPRPMRPPISSPMAGSKELNRSANFYSARHRDFHRHEQYSPRISCF